MNILVFNAYYTPEFAASLYLEEDIAEGFATSGNHVVMYVPVPSRGVTDTVRDEYKKKREEFQFNGNLHIIRYDLMKESKNPIMRALRYFLQNYRQFRCGINTQAIDAIFCGSTPPTQGLMAGFLKNKMQKKYGHKISFVYNLQDVFPDSLVGTGLAKKGGILWRIGRKIEDRTYKNADKIIVISQDFKRNLLAKGVPEEKIEVIYNWVDPGTIKPIAKEENPLFDEFGLPHDKFTIVYAGNLGNAQNVGIILDAAQLVPHVQFVIFGSGGVEEDIRSRIEREGLSNVSLLPLQPVERVSQVYSMGDICVVSCKAGLGGSAMPSKTWSILSCARPVIASFDEGELKDILEKNDCGVFTHAGDAEEFAAGIKALAASPARCIQMGLNGRQFILDNLTKEVGTKKYVNVINTVKKRETTEWKHQGN